MSTARKIVWDQKGRRAGGTQGLCNYAFTTLKNEQNKQLGRSRRSYSNNIEICPLSKK